MSSISFAKQQPKYEHIKFKKPQGSNNFALFLFVIFLHLRRNFLKINEPKTSILHLAYISKKMELMPFSQEMTITDTSHHWQHLLTS